jgi:hypothetical protein
MLGTDLTGLGQPAAGEIDLMKNWPAIGPTINATLLQGEGFFAEKGLNNRYTFINGERVDTAFHVYGAIWSPGMVQFYVNDPSNVVFVRTAKDIPAGTTWPFDNPFYLNLNVAVGGDFGGPTDTGTAAADPLLVDYVRYYQAEQVVGPAMTANSITVKNGETGTTTINLSSVSGTGLVYLTCTGNPANSTCTVDSGNTLNHSVVDFSTNSSATAMLKVSTTSTSARLDGTVSVGWAGMSIIPLLLFPFRRRVFNRRLRLGLALLSLFAVGMALDGCGGGGPSGGGSGQLVLPGSYSLTVTAATVSGDKSNVIIPLTVN